MVVVVAAQNRGGVNRRSGVERDDHVLLERQGLQSVEPVVQAHASVFAVVLGALVIPCGPCQPTLGHDAGVGVQDRAVGLKADGSQQCLFIVTGTL